MSEVLENFKTTLLSLLPKKYNLLSVEVLQDGDNQILRGLLSFGEKELEWAFLVESLENSASHVNWTEIIAKRLVSLLQRECYE